MGNPDPDYWAFSNEDGKLGQCDMRQFRSDLEAALAMRKVVKTGVDTNSTLEELAREVRPRTGPLTPGIDVVFEGPRSFAECMACHQFRQVWRDESVTFADGEPDEWAELVHTLHESPMCEPCTTQREIQAECAGTCPNEGDWTP